MTKIRFGLVVPADGLSKSNQQTYVADVNRLLNLVKGHYESAWLIDHLQFGDDPVMEGWTTLTYFSALHPELLWGHTVLCQSFRNPALLAKMCATLQVLSGGRYMLGIGAGWHEEEYRAYGYEFPSGGTRLEELEEALQIIKAMWTQDRATFEGKHHQIREARCEPKPGPLPTIMVGAFQPKMLRLTAKYADWWNVSSTGIDEYREVLQAFRQACEDVGRDPATVKLAWSGGCACAPTEAELAQILHPRLDPGEDFIGTPQQLIDQMGPFIELGVEYFIMDSVGFPKLTTAETLIRDVIPVLKGADAD